MSAPLTTISLSSRKPLLSDSEERGYPGPISMRPRWVPARARCANLAGMTKRTGWKKYSTFNHIIIYNVTIFPLQNSYLYGVDDLERPHAPHLIRYRGGARPRAIECEIQKNQKSDEQFCCCGTGSRQSQRRRRTAGQSQRLAPRIAVGKAPRRARPISQPGPRFIHPLRESKCVAQSASRLGVAP